MALIPVVLSPISNLVALNYFTNWISGDGALNSISRALFSICGAQNSNSVPEIQTKSPKSNRVYDIRLPVYC